MSEPRRNNLDGASAAPSSTANRAKAPRSACDYCHQAKVRCSGGDTCTRCKRDNIPCHYSYPARIGKPRGSKNKKTIEKLNALAQLASQNSQEEEQWIMAPLPHNNTHENATTETRIDAASTVQPDTTRARGESLVVTNPAVGPVDKPMASFASNLFPDFPDIIGAELLPFPPHLQAGSPLPTPDDFLGLPPFLSGHPQDADGEGDYDPTVFSSSNEVSDFASPDSSSSAQSESSKSALPFLDPSEWLFNPSENDGTLESSANRGCDCLQKQANHLCELRTVERRHNQPRLDNVMRLSNIIFRSLEHSLECKRCTGDLQVLHLNAMILRVLLSWIGPICRGSGNVDIQFGSYNMNREDCAWMNMLILSRLLAKSNAAIELFGKRVVSSTKGSQRLDSEYLQQVVKGLFASLNACARQVYEQKASADVADG